MSDKLKSCPFCGKTAKIVTEKFDNSTLLIKVECEKCYAKAGGYVATVFDTEKALQNIEDAKNGAVEAWNRRVSDE